MRTVYKLSCYMLQAPNVVDIHHASNHRYLPNMDMRPTLLYARMKCATGEADYMGKQFRYRHLVLHYRCLVTQIAQGLSVLCGATIRLASSLLGERLARSMYRDVHEDMRPLGYNASSHQISKRCCTCLRCTLLQC